MINLIQDKARKQVFSLKTFKNNLQLVLNNYVFHSLLILVSAKPRRVPREDRSFDAPYIKG
jgi:hypothetical protein